MLRAFFKSLYQRLVQAFKGDSAFVPNGNLYVTPAEWDSKAGLAAELQRRYGKYYDD